VYTTHPWTDGLSMMQTVAVTWLLYEAGVPRFVWLGYLALMYMWQLVRLIQWMDSNESETAEHG
jgi:hypothetical protein